jgi:Na+/melibiose symporter-like transporter
LSGYEIKGTSECSPCQSGFFSNDGTVCYACGAAEYSDKTASTHCEYCYQPNENRSACVLKSKPEEEKDAHEPISFLAWFLPLVFSMIIISVATVYYLRRKKKRYESIRYQVINSEDTEN